MVLDKEHITEILEEKLRELDAFLVDLALQPGDKIIVLADTMQGISLNELEAINRFLNEALDKEQHDFELTVSSPGMDRPFRVMKQYEKNAGREVSVLLQDGTKLQGLLNGLHAGGFELTTRVREKKEGSKKKEWVEKTIPVLFENIKETRKVITFK